MSRFDENDLINKFISALTVFGERSATLEARILSELDGMRNDIQQLRQTISAEHNTVSLPSVMEQQRITMVELISQIKPILAAPAVSEMPKQQQTPVESSFKPSQVVPEASSIATVTPQKQDDKSTAESVPASSASSSQQKILFGVGTPVSQQKSLIGTEAPSSQQNILFGTGTPVLQQKPLAGTEAFALQQKPSFGTEAPASQQKSVLEENLSSASMAVNTSAGSSSLKKSETNESSLGIGSKQFPLSNGAVAKSVTVKDQAEADEKKSEFPKQNLITFSFNPSQAVSKTTSITNVTPQKQENKATTGSVSASPAPSSQQKSLFGTAGASNTSQQKSLFGTATSTTPQQKSLFGTGVSAPQQKSMFGTGASTTPQQKSMFGTGASVPQKSMFGGNLSGSTFASMAANTGAGSNFLNKSGTNSFGADPKQFSFLTGAATKPSTAKKQVEEEGENEEAPEQFSPDDSQFKRPDIALPDLVDVKTGEEDEEVLFSGRCRLYRFVQGEDVKERGTGDMKLLKSKSTGKIRCVMRREQILKVCANFAIPPNFEVHNTKQGQNVLTWTCKDFSDPEEHPSGEQMTLICRFKDVETAKKFKEVAQSATQ